jgi:hypothetical protein
VRQEAEANQQGTEEEKSDFVYNYHKAKLTFGLLLLDFNDTVKEGDGERLFELYKMCLLIYKSAGHTKYAYIVLLTLLKLNALFSEADANQLMWNRFYNKYGGKGQNISLDLKKEQQNKMLKTFLKTLGPNLNESNATRIAEAMGSLERMMDSINLDCKLSQREGHRSIRGNEESVRQITMDLMDQKAFNPTPGREGYPSFPKFSGDLIQGLDYRDMYKWMRDKLKEWDSIYNRKNQ